MTTYAVIVGNIGTVYTGTNAKTADSHYQEYVAQSKAGAGRASGEPVTIMRNGEPWLEYIPPSMADQYNAAQAQFDAASAVILRLLPLAQMDGNTLTFPDDSVATVTAIDPSTIG